MTTAGKPIHAAVTAFTNRFGRRPNVVGIAPGRVELLGNHTDHNRGLVLAAAIDRYTCVAASLNGTNAVRAWSESTSASDEFALGAIDPLPRGSWSNYVRGPVDALANPPSFLAGEGVPCRADGTTAFPVAPLSGLDAAIAGDVPLGGGLSSSASLECAVAMAILGLLSLPGPPSLDRMRLADLLRRAEQRYAGVQCGILDQFSSLFGRAGHALFLDCDTLAHEAVPLGRDTPAIVVCDSGAPRELAKGKYNERRAECEAASEFLHRLNPQLPCGEVRSLRDIPLQVFLEHRPLLDPTLARRARHVLTENQRVRTGVELLRRSGDVRALGELMLESHRSSRDDFENSSPELDLLIDVASRQPGFLGGKLSGAGWGGCTVNLVEPSRAEQFAASVGAEFRSRCGVTPSILICHTAAGAHFVPC